MTTLKQIEANRRNSRISTGPKTRTGKTKTKMNAMKHGLLATDLVVRGEDPVEFAGVLENLVDELKPQGPLEEQLVERVSQSNSPAWTAASASRSPTVSNFR